MITLLLLILAIALIVMAVRLRRRRLRRRVMIVKLVAIIVLAIAVFYIVKYQPLPSRSSNRDGKFGSAEPSQMWDGLTALGSKA
jgi:formate hydrogenlyase subunit 3/multisubunit Na+/H+ antiporter MnhD subunit